MDASHPKSRIQNTYMPAFSIFNVNKIAILSIYYSLINGKCPSVSFLQRNFCDHTEIRANHPFIQSVIQWIPYLKTKWFSLMVVLF